MPILNAKSITYDFANLQSRISRELERKKMKKKKKKENSHT